MAETSASTVLLKATGTYVGGEEYDYPLRVQATHWRQLGGKASIEKGEKGVAQFLRLRDPRLGSDLRITYLRDENVKASEMKVRPSDF
jgi:hypothetical protein